MSAAPDAGVAPPPGGATPPAPVRVGRRTFGGGIWGFILRRVLLGLLTLALVSVVVFVATQLLPSDAAQAILGKNATPESLATLRQQLGLDRSAISQYLDWVGGLLQGDLGDSLQAQAPITDVIGDRVVNSSILVLASALISIPLGIAIGAYAALRRDRLFDTTSGIATLLLAAVPEFAGELVPVATP